MIRRPPRSTRVRSSAASDVYKRQCQNVPVNALLGRAVHLWPTPDTGRTERLESFEARHKRMKERHPTKGGMGSIGPLHIAVQRAVHWRTPQARDWKGPQDKGEALDLPAQVGGALNPTWVAWLMGYPPEWVSCAPSAMPSSRKSRRNSSVPTMSDTEK